MAKPFDLAVGEWWAATATGNYRISDVYPSPNPGGTQTAIINAWSGAAFDSSRNDILVCNGGHTDYAGNEVYAYNVDPLDGNFLQWRRKSFPSTRDDGTNVEEYSGDGSPSARHTYNSISYDPVSDQMFLLPGGYVWGSTGNFSSQLYAFDCATETPNTAQGEAGAWTQKTTPASFPQSDSVAPMAVYDSANEVFVQYCNKGLATYDPATDTWTNQTSFDDINSTANYGVVYVPGSPPHMVLIGATFTQAKRLDTFATSDNSVSSGSWGITGSTAIQDATAPGLIYCTRANKIFGWAGLLSGGTDRRDYYEIDYATKVSTLRTGTGDIPTAPNGNGTYSKFVYLGDGLCAVFNSTTETVYFLRVAESINAPANNQLSWIRA